MRHSTFSTNSKNNKGYDIICIDYKRRSYSLYLNYKDDDVNPFGEWPKAISRIEFDRLLGSYKKYEEFDLSAYDPDNYERFYRESHYSEDDVDIIVINAVKKEYTLGINTDEMNVDGYDLIGNPIFSTYVSDAVFDVIVMGVNAKGFKMVEKFDDFV
ncbi:MAG: hypothetical protein IJ039_05210 [Clostridia bacterium]|nr:hypothetical protein [Clostridia bacterium]